MNAAILVAILVLSTSMRSNVAPLEHVGQTNSGKYSIIVVDEGPILLDTATGDSWRLVRQKQSTVWMPIRRIELEPVPENESAFSLLKRLDAEVRMKDGVVIDVNLIETSVTDAQLQVIASIGSLEHLTLQACPRVSDAGLSHIRRLTRLQGLNLTTTRVTDVGMENLKDLTDLGFLALNDTRIGDDGLRRLSGLKKIGVLYLNATNTTDAGLAYFEQMTQMQWLDLGSTRVSDTGLARLALLSNMRLLSLNGTKISDAGLKHLSGLKHLVSLSLQDTIVSDAGMVALSKLPGLKQLDLRNTAVTHKGVTIVKDTLPKCEIKHDVARGAAEKKHTPALVEVCCFEE